jgi:hypothetical protein
MWLCVLHCQVIYFLTDLPAIIVADLPLFLLVDAEINSIATMTRANDSIISSFGLKQMLGPVPFLDYFIVF